MPVDPSAFYCNGQYLKYFRARVNEANASTANQSNIVEGDTMMPCDEACYRLLDKITFNAGSILDVGCGLGRFFSYYKKRNLRITGIDISSEMIAAAKEESPESGADLRTGIAEEIPFPNNYFDNCISMGVFDATLQHQALSEMLRVVRLGGLVIITGKNWQYVPNDRLAYAAEIGARMKAEPNYFTDCESMISQIINHGHCITKEFYFKERGDFQLLRYTTCRPREFYEYLLVVEKLTEGNSFLEFSHTYSLVHQLSTDRNPLGEVNVESH